jgi:sulfur carrier protein ThiS adenylyltransferase
MHYILLKIIITNSSIVDCRKMTQNELRIKLKDKTVGIAGCGGLGSNAAIALARIGIGNLVIVDFDRVEESNLNRQYYFREQIGNLKVEALAVNISKIDQTINVEMHAFKIQPSEIKMLFGKCDVIIEAFDLADAKIMLVETVMEQLPLTPIIVGNGMAGIGGFEQLKIIKWAENVYVCGDGLSEIKEDLPPLAPRVAIVANMQANLALELLIK